MQPRMRKGPSCSALKKGRTPSPKGGCLGPSQGFLLEERHQEPEEVVRTGGKQRSLLTVMVSRYFGITVHIIPRIGSPSHFPPKRECGGILSVNLLAKALLCPQTLLQKWQPAVVQTICYPGPPLFLPHKGKRKKNLQRNKLGLQIISEMT